MALFGAFNVFLCPPYNFECSPFSFLFLFFACSLFKFVSPYFIFSKALSQHLHKLMQVLSPFSSMLPQTLLIAKAQVQPSSYHNKGLQVSLLLLPTYVYWKGPIICG